MFQSASVTQPFLEVYNNLQVTRVGLKLCDLKWKLADTFLFPTIYDLLNGNADYPEYYLQRLAFAFYYNLIYFVVFVVQ